MAKNKRGNNEGTVTRRKDGRWEARYMVQTPAGPKRKTIYGQTRKDVSAKLTKAMADRDVGLVFDDEKITVGEFLDRWLSDAVRGTVRESTFDRDSYLIRLHVKPALGCIRLSRLSPVHVQGFYRDRLDAGLSASTVNKMHTILHKALAQAVRWSLIPRNVTEAVRAPRPTPREMCPLSAEEARRLLDAAKGEELEALYVLAVTTGMRLGELLGLGWSDIDLENASVTVRRTLTRTGPSDVRSRVPITASGLPWAIRRPTEAGGPYASRRMP